MKDQRKIWTKDIVLKSIGRHKALNLYTFNLSFPMYGILGFEIQKKSKRLYVSRSESYVFLLLMSEHLIWGGAFYFVLGYSQLTMM